MKSFDEFLIEAQKSHAEVAKTIGSQWEKHHPGMKLNVQHRTEPKEHLYLGYLEVPKDQRRKGLGGRAVKGITKYADKNNLPVSVKPVADKGYEKKLDKFYADQGFENNDKKDVAPHPMIRKPKSKK